MTFQYLGQPLLPAGLPACLPACRLRGALVVQARPLRPPPCAARPPAVGAAGRHFSTFLAFLRMSHFFLLGRRQRSSMLGMHS